MKKVKIYKYIGRNGTITSPILLDGVTKINMYNLSADSGKILTDGEQKLYVVNIFADDLDKWQEIDDEGQN